MLALDDARFDAWAGEVTAVLGENGAGKTTLLSTLSGLLQPDSGVIEIDGRPVRLTSPREGWRSGVGMVHQHFALVEAMTVLENLALGLERGSRFRLDLDALRVEATALAERVGLEVPLDATVSSLGVGDRQRAEVLKVLLRDPSVLVLDEPTAVLAPAEVEGLLSLLRRLADEGRAVVLVAHKLDEVLAVADRITVLRDGRTVLEAARADVDARRLSIAMVGSEPVELPRRPVEWGRGPAVARLEAVRLDENPGTTALHGVDLRVYSGEIVGVAGVEGNGQRELCLVLSGRLHPDAGEVDIPDEPAFIPQDRRREGLVGSFDLVSNMAVGLHRDPRFRSGPFVPWGRVRERTRSAIEAYGIRAPGPEARASSLSGGNQQRLVVARELDGRPRLIVAENPTRGLDVAGAAFVHRVLRERTEDYPPAGVVLVSTDLDEILAISDRVVVLIRGRLIEVPDDERTREGIGARMLEGAT